MIFGLQEVARQIIVITLVYYFGRFNFSAAWLVPLFFSSYHTVIRHNRETDHAIARATSSTSERNVIFAGLQDIPAWVVFPDTERLQWVNTILRIFWPKINGVVETALKTFEVKIRSLPTLSTFQFKKIELGKIVRFYFKIELLKKVFVCF